MALTVVVGIAWRSSLKISQLMEDVGEMKAILSPNGGSSIADKINRIDEKVHSIEDRTLHFEQEQLMIAAELPFGIYHTDRDGRMTYANSYYRRLTGRSIEELLGTGWINSIHPNDRGIAFQQWTDAVRDERDYDDVQRLVGIAGDVQTVRVKAHPKIDADGNLVGYIGTVVLINLHANQADVPPSYKGN